MRLDKYLAQMSVGTRSEVKKFIKSGRVFVNDIPAGKPEQQITEQDFVTVDGNPLVYKEYEYYMLNKPQGTVSATTDNHSTTVVSLIKSCDRRDLFPVGRLDKDTEGLLLLTNDGALAHELLSPKKHVWKTYLVKAQGIVTPEDIQKLELGIDIGDEKITLPAKAQIKEILPAEKDMGEAEKNTIGEKPETPVESKAITWLELTIREGRYHQVKRMMAAIGKPVLFLKRLSVGSLRLDEGLKPGEYRELTKEEVEQLKNRNESQKVGE